MDKNDDQPHAPGMGDRNSPGVYSIMESKDGALWIGTIGDPVYPSHLLRYDPITRTSQNLPVTSQVWGLYESSDGTIWVVGAGMSGKVLRIRPKSKSYDLFHRWFFNRHFGASPVRRKLVDYDHNFMIFGPLDMTIDPANGHYWFEAIVAAKFGSDEFSLAAVLAEYNPENDLMEYHHLDHLLDIRSDNTLSSNLFGSKGMAIDKQGRIWGSFANEHDGIYRYDPKSGITEEYANNPGDSTSLTSNHIITLMMDSRGEIWVATFGQGLNRLDPGTGKISHYHFGDVATVTDLPMALMEAHNGKIWVAGEFMENGLNYLVVIDPNSNDVEKIFFPNDGTFRSIRSMAQSPITHNVAFVIDCNGIGIYDPVNRQFYFLETQGNNIDFPIPCPAAVVCDEEGFFWYSNEDAGNFVRANRSTTYTFQDSYGLPSVPRVGFLGSNGHVYFLNEQGWTEIDPQTIDPSINADSTRLSVVSLNIFGEKQVPGENDILPQPIYMMDGVRLPANTESFGIRFSDFQFQSKDRQFAYRLYPFEASWNIIKGSPVANYYKVPSGEYTFQVNIQNENEMINTGQFASLDVIIDPPWWLTWWAYGLYVFIFCTGVYGIHRFQKARVIRTERERTKDRELAQAKEIEKAYEELKTTQAQLIHSEKMASLGELTAGIAHEIQNPLNFVNNFSEVNSELTQELKEEIKKGNTEEVKAIAADIEENEKKIVHHGKRAEAIVKSMLQHSRGSEGIKEQTDINTLADEYLRLAYHGFRAKDKSFNANFKTDLDEGLPKISVVPQDIGRVLLNLINNAFQAVKDVDKPTVTVSTRKKDGKVEVWVKDNGPGIPYEIKDKIFQPFFTTKPTGIGTGLGLSLSYDIVTKGHGGSIKVNSIEGEGTEFIILLPA